MLFVMSCLHHLPKKLKQFSSDGCIIQFVYNMKNVLNEVRTPKQICFHTSLSAFDWHQMDQELF